jgi:hypothetical protein
MERRQATEQQNRRQGVGVFTQDENIPGDIDQSTASDNRREAVKVFERPQRTFGFPTSLIVAVVIIVALVILAIVVL